MIIGSIVIQCYKFEKMVVFWKEALQYVFNKPPRDGWVILRDPKGVGPNISLDKVDNKRSGKGVNYT